MSTTASSNGCLSVAIPVHNSFWDVDKPSVLIAFFVCLVAGGLLLVLLAKCCLHDILKHRQRQREEAELGIKRITSPQRKTPSRKKEKKAKETTQRLEKLQTTPNLIAPWKRKEIALKSMENDNDLIILPINLRVWTSEQTDKNDRLDNENEYQRSNQLSREGNVNNNRLPSITGEKEVQENRQQLAPVANVLLLSSVHEVRYKLAAIATDEVRNFQLELEEEQIMARLLMLCALLKQQTLSEKLSDEDFNKLLQTFHDNVQDEAFYFLVASRDTINELESQTSINDVEKQRLLDEWYQANLFKLHDVIVKETSALGDSLSHLPGWTSADVASVFDKVTAGLTQLTQKQTDEISEWSEKLVGKLTYFQRLWLSQNNVVEVMKQKMSNSLEAWEMTLKSAIDNKLLSDKQRKESIKLFSDELLVCSNNATAELHSKYLDLVQKWQRSRDSKQVNVLHENEEVMEELLQKSTHKAKAKHLVDHFCQLTHDNRDQLWATADDIDEKAAARLSKVLKEILAQVEASLQKIESRVTQQLQTSITDRSKITAVEESFENNKEKLAVQMKNKQLQARADAEADMEHTEQVTTSVSQQFIILRQAHNDPQNRVVERLLSTMICLTDDAEKRVKAEFKLTQILSANSLTLLQLHYAKLFERRLALAGLQEETERRIALEKEKKSFFKQRDNDKRERQQEEERQKRLQKRDDDTRRLTVDITDAFLVTCDKYFHELDNSFCTSLATAQVFDARKDISIYKKRKVEKAITTFLIEHVKESSELVKELSRLQKQMAGQVVRLQDKLHQTHNKHLLDIETDVEKFKRQKQREVSERVEQENLQERKSLRKKPHCLAVLSEEWMDERQTMMNADCDLAVTRRLQCHTVQLNQQLDNELEQQLHTMRHDFIVKAVVLSKLNKAAMRELSAQLSTECGMSEKETKKAMKELRQEMQDVESEEVAEVTAERGRSLRTSGRDGLTSKSLSRVEQLRSSEHLKSSLRRPGSASSNDSARSASGHRLRFNDKNEYLGERSQLF